MARRTTKKSVTQSPGAAVQEAPAAAETSRDATVKTEAAATEIAAREVSAGETLQPAPVPVGVGATDIKPFTALCHVKMDGELKEPGATLLLTRSAFEELKKAKAVAGEW